MKFGVSLANVAGADAPVDWCLDVARRADGLGYDSVWAHDHVAIPVGTAFDDPYNPRTDGGGKACYDPLMIVSAVAAATRRVQVGTCAFALPFRHPAITAKMLATADLLANGRVVLGVGTGSLRQEFEALGLPGESFENRDAMTDEYLRAIKEMWLSTGPSSFIGEHVSFRDVGTFPKPKQRPHPPIMVAGDDVSAMIRASRHGTGWLSTFVTPEQLTDQVARLREICRKDRRDSSEIEVHMLAPVSLSDQPLDGGRAQLAGSVEQIWDDLRTYGRAGLCHLILCPDVYGEADRHAATLRTIERFATEILPAFDRQQPGVQR